jgi:hypothetical protein
MKKSILSIIVMAMLLSMALFVASCNSSDNDGDGGISGVVLDPEELDPSQVDFYFAVTYLDFDEWDYREDYYVLNVIPINPMIDVENVIVMVDNEEIQGEFYYGYFIAEVQLNPGQEYEFKLIAGDTTYSANLKTTYNATNASFPDEFNPSQSHTVSWSLSNNNQYQIADAWSYLWDWENEDNDQESEYMKALSPSDRQHTFPANAVENFGPETEYELAIVQVNMKTSGKLVMMANSGVWADYYDYDYKNEDMKEKIANRSQKIIELLK